jgi:hypothetical protein
MRYRLANQQRAGAVFCSAIFNQRFAVQYSTSPQKRSKEGGRALSVEAPLGMSMEMLTFDTNLGSYRTDITEQQIRGAPAFSRDQTSTNVEAFA